MEHRDRLWPGGYTFLYDDGLFRPSTDTFLLGSFPRLRRGMAVCELGAGTGLLSLLLLAREPELTVTGVELQPQACALFRRTAEENGLQGRMHCLEGDLRQGLLPPGRFRLAVANPPYFPPDAGAVAPDAARRTARAETDCTLSQLCAAAARALTWGGSFCLVHRPDRLADVLEELRRVRLEPKRLRFVHHTAAARPSLFLLEARLGSEYLAANALLLNLLTVSAFALDALAYGVEIKCGQALGARRLDRLQAYWRAACRQGALVAGLLGLAYLLLGDRILALLTHQPDLLALAQVYLPWHWLLPLIGVWSYLWDGLFVAATDGRAMRNSLLLASLGFALALTSLPWLGNHALWLAMSLFLALRALALAWIWRYRHHNGRALMAPTAAS